MPAKIALMAPGLFFVRASRLERWGQSTAAEHLGGMASLELLAQDPDEDGWEWVDVWFDRNGAETIAQRHLNGQTTVISEATDMHAQDVTGLGPPELFEVVSVEELLESGGYEAVGRALVAVRMSLAGRLKQFEAGVRFEAPSTSEPPDVVDDR